jgi:hypothetical protein
MWVYSVFSFSINSHGIKSVGEQAAVGFVPRVIRVWGLLQPYTSSGDDGRKFV